MEPYFASGIVVAAGNSTRMRGIDKKFVKLGDKTVLEHSVAALSACDFIREILVVTREEDMQTVQELFCNNTKVTMVLSGGNSRQESVLKGIKAADAASSYFVIHDGARPLVCPEEISRCFLDAVEFGAAALCAPLSDTIKERGEDGKILRTHDRTRLFACHTPQIFSAKLYRQAAEKATAEGRDFTDDCQLFEFAGYPVHLTVSYKPNLKITTPDDLSAARVLLEEKRKMIRIGHGYDAHRLVEGRELILGGVRIPYEKGLLGHSDADVLLHAVMDSILGALALGDIGMHFPDSDIAYKDADSMMLLSRVCELMRESGYQMGNLDVTVVAQAPKLKDHIPTMREKISEILGTDCINVKATTEEKMGFTGRGEGISATAVCLLMPV